MSALQEVTHIDNVRLGEDGKSVVILDQTQLPNRTIYETLRTAEELYTAIKTLQVRGAPAIGICAGYGLAALARQSAATDRAAFDRLLREQSDYLVSSRPTAVNLSWAARRMCALLDAHGDWTVPQMQDALEAEARAIHREDIEMCRAISEHGLSLLKEGDGILTHCNAGPLATSRYGTALGPIFLGTERGMHFRVFAELQKGGVDVTLICDNMASIVMKNGWINACFVGCDRVAANGDTANKIGTSGVAILAKYYGIPFYVLGPTSTIDMNCPTGADIRIEERDPEEIKTKFYAEPMALPKVKCYNPAFDVTDHSLIAGIITEKGICRPPFSQNLPTFFRERT